MSRAEYMRSWRVTIAALGRCQMCGSRNLRTKAHCVECADKHATQAAERMRRMRERRKYGEAHAV